jgi:adenylate kinase
MVTMQHPLTFIFVGRSGSGKGTQSGLLQKYISEHTADSFNYSFDMGTAFRTFMALDGYPQTVAREIINTGNLMPDFMTITLFTNALLENLKDQNLFIDGIPRSVAQVDAVMHAMMYFKRINPIIIDISISSPEARGRMLARARADDTDASIASRFAFYENTVLPAVKYLREKSGYTYFEFDGERSIEEIHQDIVARLKPLLPLTQ